MANQPNEQIAQLQAQLAGLKQENAELRSQLEACQLERRSQSAEDLQPREVTRDQERFARDCVSGSSLEHRLLEAIATAATALLTITPLDAAVNAALQIIGEALDTDRVVVLENFDNPSDASSVWWMILYEWTSPYAMPQIAHPDLAQGSHKGIEEWYVLLSQGQGISCLLEDMPEPFQSGQAELGLKALHVVPIVVEGKYWGVIGFDDCREAKHRSSTELAVLKIAADCVGSAIQRQRTQQATHRAEQEFVKELRQRDRLLSVVAQITQDLLAAEDVEAAIPSALQAVGEVADMSRVLLILERQDPTTQRCQHCVEHEWIAVGTSNHAAVGMAVMDNKDFQVLIQPLYDGQSVWRVIDNLPEVTRSRFEKLDIKSTGVVPIFIEGRYIGCVGFDDCVTSRHWSQQEIDVLTAAAESIGAALYRKQLVERLIGERIRSEQERAAELAKANEALCRGVERLAEAGNIDVLLDSFLLEAIRVTGASSGAVMARVTGTEFQLRALAQDGVITRPSDPDAFGSVLRVTARDPVGALGQIVEGQVYCHEVDDYYASWFPEAAVYHRQQGHQVTWNFPFRVGQEVVGYLAMAFREKRSPNQVMTETVQSLAHQVSLALETLRLAEEASQLAIFQERNHIAREVHDTLAQDFAGILMQLQAVLCFMDANPAQAHTHLNRARDLARTGITAARRSVWALRQDSSDYSEFLHLLTHLIEQMALGTSVHTQVQVQGTPYPLPSEVGLNLLRIAQEAITNALRHADAERLELQLNYKSNCVQLSIQDNGRGFDLQILMRGLGLMGMQQRADLIGAQLDISSVPGAGTTITMKMPIFRKNEAEPRDN